MTDNERVLHTVLSTCLKPFPAVFGNEVGVAKAELDYVRNRLEEIEQIVTRQIAFNAAKNER